MRHIRFKEEVSGLSVRCELLENEAPQSARFLWDLASHNPTYDAMHAMWTGPEISCPIPAPLLPAGLSEASVPEENATSYPEVGEIVLTYLPNRSIKGLPPGNFFDIGLFYGPGGRLLMPFGWIRANVCARIVVGELEEAQNKFKQIRSNGACRLTLETA